MWGLTSLPRYDFVRFPGYARGAGPLAERLQAERLRYNQAIMAERFSEDLKRRVLAANNIVDVVQEEATEDIHRMGATGVLDEP